MSSILTSNCPRIVIAATNSGAGKTSIALGLTAALRRRGLKVQTYKVGPDFLDPSYLAIASGRTCYNLDSWMMGKEYVSQLFVKTSCDADIAVIEGVMGLFDGASATTLEASTAEVAALLKAAVILISSAHGLARSFAAVIKGFVSFEDSIKIDAIIANRTGSARHKQWLTESFEEASLPPLIGAVKRYSLPQLLSRDLGLVTADNETLSCELIGQLADVCQKSINIDALLEIASKAKPVEAKIKEEPNDTKKIRMGVAKDKAFHFYYPDNLEALKKRGCQIVEFSPLCDPSVPDNLTGLYIGGGYPEVHAKQLSANKSMLKSIRDFACSGKTIYAECGGLMYLGNKLITSAGEEFPMAGVLEIDTQMLERFKSLGYVEVRTTAESLWGPKGSFLRGHEFHYSEITNNHANCCSYNQAYTLQRRSDSESSPEGFQKTNILASYVHLHFASRCEIVNCFVKHLEGNHD